MKKRIIIPIVILSSLFLIGFISFRTGSRPDKSMPCKESMKDCCKKKNTGSDNLIWETLSRQFFSYGGVCN